MTEKLLLEDVEIIVKQSEKGNFISCYLIGKLGGVTKKSTPF